MHEVTALVVAAGGLPMARQGGPRTAHFTLDARTLTAHAVMHLRTNARDCNAPHIIAGLIAGAPVSEPPGAMPRGGLPGVALTLLYRNVCSEPACKRP